MAFPELLATKAARPPLPATSLERPDLFTALAEPRAVTLVTAPPGYGKTTLVSGWLASHGRAAGWLTLDESDNDPATFLAYLVAAVRNALPALDPGVEAAIASLPPSPPSLAPLLNAMGETEDPVVLVLDDYHLVTSPRVHGLVVFIVTHLPPNVRVVIATRHDPPLPLARLRARGQLTEIRAGDLRFTAADAHHFLTGPMGLPIGEATSERLTERTDGWIAGLQLAALALRGRNDVEAFVHAFGASDRYIFDYLTDEALAGQPPDVQSFLEATSILERLNGSLCDAITGRTDGASTLAALATANLFLTPLDHQRAWYRYHPLFAELLASNVPADRRAELHLAAAAWFAAHDLPYEGIRHGLAAGQPEQAAALMEDVADLTAARGEFRTIIGWCDALPGSTLRGHPALGVVDAWARFFVGDIAGAKERLAAVDDPGGRDPRSSSRRAGLEAWFANRHDRPEAASLARKVIEGIPDSDPVFRSLAFTTLGESLVGRDVRSAGAAFEEAHRLAQVAHRSALAVGTVYSLATTRLVQGRRRDAEEICRHEIGEVTGLAGGSTPWLGVLYLPLGVSLFEADELVLARQQFATGQELTNRADLRVTMLGAAEWQEILVLHLIGERGQAWHRLEAVRRDAERHGIRRVAVGMGLLAAELLLLEGDPTGARDQLEHLPGSFLDGLGAVRDRGRETSARVHLALRQPREALDILEPLAVEQREAGRLGRLIATLVLLALARERAGDRSSSGDALGEAVGLAAAQDYRRVFMDRVLPIDHLLARARSVAPAFVDDLLERLGGMPTSRAVHAAQDRAQEALVEPLTVRELEILRLVAAGLSNDEIGRELFVTPGTAKWHVHNVLGKVGAPNRAALIARARSLGLV